MAEKMKIIAMPCEHTKELPLLLQKCEENFKNAEIHIMGDPEAIYSFGIRKYKIIPHKMNSIRSLLSSLLSIIFKFKGKYDGAVVFNRWECSSPFHPFLKPSAILAALYKPRVLISINKDSVKTYYDKVPLLNLYISIFFFLVQGTAAILMHFFIIATATFIIILISILNYFHSLLKRSKK